MINSLYILEWSKSLIPFLCLLRPLQVSEHFDCLQQRLISHTKHKHNLATSERKCLPHDTTTNFCYLFWLFCCYKQLQRYSNLSRI